MTIIPHAICRRMTHLFGSYTGMMRTRSILLASVMLTSVASILTSCTCVALQSPSGGQVLAADPLRPTRLPAKRSPQRLPRIESERESSKEKTDQTRDDAQSIPSDAQREDRSQAELLPPLSMTILIDERMPVTGFDTSVFERSISSTLASGWRHQRDDRPHIVGGVSEIDGTWADDSTCRDQGCGDYYNDFSPTPLPTLAMSHDPFREQWAYDAKREVATQHPWVEWGRIFYGNGITPRGINWFGHMNMVRPELYVYGDFRSGIATGRNATGRTDNWANRLNLDVDLKVTDTERFHAFWGPLNQGGDVTRWELVDGDIEFRDRVNFSPLTGFFEGDLGVLLGSAFDQSSPFELPFTIGLVPLLFQNGIWMEDAVTGAAFSLPAGHSRLLNWSNYDATFFAVVDQLNSPAFAADNHAAQAFGTAWFIEAYRGYIETGYAYVRDRHERGLSYHNITASYTRRYFDRISNSMRVVVNAGQDLPRESRTADGVLLLAENSWITSNPLRVVPYANFFVGWDRPQSVARAGVSGGILRNTGINFDTDGLSGFATLDPTASDTAGGSIGVDLLGDDLDRQLLLEVSYLTPHGSQSGLVPDDQYAIGSRYQFPISNSSLLRFDAMYGWRQGLEDVYGTRMEYRWKF